MCIRDEEFPTATLRPCFYRQSFLLCFCLFNYLDYPRDGGFLGCVNCYLYWFEEFNRFQLKGILRILCSSGNFFADVFHDLVLFGWDFSFLFSACVTDFVAYFNLCSAGSSRLLPSLLSIYFFDMYLHLFFASASIAHYSIYSQLVHCRFLLSALQFQISHCFFALYFPVKDSPPRCSTFVSEYFSFSASRMHFPHLLFIWMCAPFRPSFFISFAVFTLLFVLLYLVHPWKIVTGHPYFTAVPKIIFGPSPAS